MQSSRKADRKNAPENLYRKPAKKELALLRIIHRNHDVSRVELVELTGFSAGLITAIVQDLITKGLLPDEDPSPSRCATMRHTSSG